MRTLLLKLEPLIWFMFGQGIMIGTMLLTGWILVVGLLVPLGIVDASALDYSRAHGLATAKLLGLPIDEEDLEDVAADERRGEETGKEPFVDEEGNVVEADVTGDL